MEAATILGTIAGSLTSLALLPQLLRIWRSRSAEDVSAGTFAIMSAGIALWVVYGFSIRSGPVIVFNAVTLVLSLAILVLKMRYRGR